jgi:hypothetical protein
LRLGADISCGFGHHVRDTSKTLGGGIREVGAQDVAASREEDLERATRFADEGAMILDELAGVSLRAGC